MYNVVVIIKGTIRCEGDSISMFLIILKYRNNGTKQSGNTKVPANIIVSKSCFPAKGINDKYVPVNKIRIRPKEGIISGLNTNEIIFATCVVVLSIQI
jgi:hypothetical protein